MYAAFGTTPTWRVLLDAGADLEAGDSDGKTALFSAAEGGRQDLTALLFTPEPPARHAP